MRAFSDWLADWWPPLLLTALGVLASWAEHRAERIWMVAVLLLVFALGAVYHEAIIRRPNRHH